MTELSLLTLFAICHWSFHVSKTIYMSWATNSPKKSLGVDFQSLTVMAFLVVSLGNRFPAECEMHSGESMLHGR